MEQHAIPQQISSYQFRLVGDMTLKQFFQVAGGALLSLLIYSLPIHPIFKWPLIIFFFASGAAMAFLPFQERPLEKWVIAFFRSVYSPTIYTWKQFSVAPIYFQPEQQMQTDNIPQHTNTSNKHSGIPFLSNLEEAESSFLNKVGTLFNSSPTPVQNQTVSTIPLPSLQTPIANSQVISKPITPVQVPISTPTPVQQQHTPQPISTQPKIVVQEIGNNNIPANNLNQINNLGGQVFATQHPPTTQAQFSPEAAPPHIPEKPNLVSGQVMDAVGKIVEGAILEIIDEQSRPVRALRSNKAGHFMIVTPLLNGKYQLLVDKDGLEFAPLTFETKGEIIQPIAIKAKKSLNAS